MSPVPLEAFDELRAVEDHGRLHGHGLEKHEVALGESPALLVQHLRNADGLALHRADRHTKNASGDEAGLLVHRRIEMLGRAGVVRDHAASGREDVSSDARPFR